MRTNRFSNPLFMAVITAMTLSACGKNMSVAMKDPANALVTVNANEKQEVPTPGITKTSKAISSRKAKPIIAQEAPLVQAKEVDTPPVPVSVLPATVLPAPVSQADPLNEAVVESAVEAGDGELHPYSVFDLADTNAKRIYKNEAKIDATQVIGSPSYADRETGVGFVKSSNVVFRSILQIAAKDSIKEVTKFELVLAGLRLYDAKGTGLDKQSLKNQMLCIAETGECSGELPRDADKGNLVDASKLSLKSDAFSKVELNNFLDYHEQGAVFENGHEIRLNMIELFGLQKLSASELADWIYANSTEFAKPGYRKFRFVMGNNLFVEGGVLNLVYKTTQPPAADVKQEVVLNGETDAQTPILSTPILMPELASITDMTQTAATGVLDNNARPMLSSPAAPADVVTHDAVVQAAAQDQTAQDPAPVSEAPVADSALITPTNSAPVVMAAAPSPLDMNPLDAINDENESAAKPAEAPKPIVEVVKNKKGNYSLVLHLDEYHLYFLTGSAEVKTADDIYKLVDTADLIKKNGTSVQSVTIYGRVDKQGSRALNGKLSKKRAEKVKSLMEARANTTINTIGMPEPKSSSCGKGKKAENCQKDRRVDIKINYEANAKKSTIKAMRVWLAQIWKLSKKQN